MKSKGSSPDFSLEALEAFKAAALETEDAELFEQYLSDDMRQVVQSLSAHWQTTDLCTLQIICCLIANYAGLTATLEVSELHDWSVRLGISWVMIVANSGAGKEIVHKAVEDIISFTDHLIDLRMAEEDTNAPIQTSRTLNAVRAEASLLAC